MIARNESNAEPVGRWKIQRYRGAIRRDRRGRILNKHLGTYRGRNLITTVGKQLIMDRLFALASAGAMTRIGAGTSNTAAAIGNTTLTGGAFVNFDALPTRAGLVVTCVGTFPPGTGTFAWAELGMDNGATLLNRLAPVGPYTKAAGDTFIVTITITQS